MDPSRWLNQSNNLEMMINMKAIFGVLAVALCAIPVGQASAAACRQALLDGVRTMLPDNCRGACGAYEVDAAMTTDLGFGGTLPDTISFEFVALTPQSTPETGTFSLSSAINANYQTCQQCILILQDENSSIGTPQKTFFQTGGTLDIDPGTVPGAAPDVALTWTNVTLAEVTIDGDNVSTLVPNGDCYTIVVDRIFISEFE
jgi:hypothetical protein